MLDLKKVREQLNLYKADLKKRGSTVDVDAILLLDDQRKALQQQIDALKFQQKELASKQDYEGAKALKSDIQTQETAYTAIMQELNEKLLTLPNFIAPNIPEGKSDADNVEIRKV